ncbi:MAG: rubrerythrin family protein [Armatimonadota bacterium]|nr:rubrerythrin family protein [Armatimonadota bacterium]
MDLKGSRTEQNILTAFAGEAQARNRYTYFAEKARDEGYEQIAAVFEETANQERAHAKRLFEFLEGGEVEIAAGYPAGSIGTTAENLKAAAEGEHYENSEMYPGFAAVADEEGFRHIAAAFRAIAKAEVGHEARYRALLANVEGDKVFERDTVVVWRCRNCGYLHEGTEAPNTCAACHQPRAQFEVYTQNW